MTDHKVYTYIYITIFGFSPPLRDSREFANCVHQTTISHRSHPIAMSTRNHLIVVSFGIEKPGPREPVFTHARVTRPPTTKVTRRPVATPAWREARRVLERGRRDDRRRGGRIDDDGGASGERTAEWRTDKEGRENAYGGWNRIGEKSATRREGCEGCDPHYDPFTPRIKKRSYLPYFTPSPRLSPRDAAQSPEHWHTVLQTQNANSVRYNNW